MTTTEKPAEAMVTVEDPDPMWDIPVGDISPRSRWDELEEYWKPYGEDHYTTCGASNEDAVRTGEWIGHEDYDGYTCSRREHPEHWKHIATSGSRVLGYWGGVDPAQMTMVPADIDTDEPFDVEIGKLYKFRNRRTLMMVVGKRRESGVDKVEVLDMQHERYRVLDVKQLAPRRDDMIPTPEQFKWVATFMATRRQEVRNNALQQRRDGYFKSAKELNGILDELGLEPYQARRQGTFRPQFSIRVTGMEDRDAKAKLAEWFKTLKPPPGIEFMEIPQTRNMAMDLYDQS